jgi:hypothetical protein
MKKITEHIDEARQVNILNMPTNSQQYASVYNSTLSNIGGQTTNFESYDGIRKLYDSNPDFFAKPEIQLITKSIVDKYNEYHRVIKEFADEADEFRQIFRDILKAEFGTDNLNQINKGQ